MPNGYVKRLLCLANSRKFSGRCVAGKEIVGANAGSWIRPVSSRQSSELSITERWYGDGQQVKVFDIFRIALNTKKAHAYQPENHEVDTSYYCAFEGALTWNQALNWIDVFEGGIWINGYSSRYGLNDQVPLLMAPILNSSLKFINVKNFSVLIQREWPEFGNSRKIRGTFTYNDINYILGITDPLIELNYAGAEDGTYSVGEALICLSLAEPYKGNAYKLIATVAQKS